ncbi:MAG: hypothetical protein LBT95_06945 [Treponema sp.]|jgi:hypothetical protein|nr:hypothetical protein [Treponema sp.]
MYQHPKLAAFTDTLDALFREADEILEERWGDRFSLHPNRPRRGTTGNPEMDGLFEIIPDFTPGFGSQKGRGYLISFRVATLERVPPAQFEDFMDETAACVRELLPRYFPGRKLEVVRDGKRYKITGNFSLGEI